MKTPDEIKKGLECHTNDDIVSCDDCPYYYDCYETARSNGAVMAMDTLAYTRQLEAKVSELEERCDAEQINASHAIIELATVRSQCIKAIENVIKATPKWISVEERLPEDGENVLVYAIGNNEDSVVAMTSYTHRMYGYNIEGWCSPWQYFFCEYKITHWMPLPEPPKESAE